MEDALINNRKHSFKVNKFEFETKCERRTPAVLSHKYCAKKQRLMQNRTCIDEASARAAARGRSKGWTAVRCLLQFVSFE